MLLESLRINMDGTLYWSDWTVQDLPALVLESTKPAPLRPHGICFIDARASIDVDAAFLDVFRNPDWVIDGIVFLRDGTVELRDTINFRCRIVPDATFARDIMPSLLAYATHGSRVFLEVAFEDPAFRKACWNAFKQAFSAVELHGIFSDEAKAKMLLQLLLLVRAQDLGWFNGDRHFLANIAATVTQSLLGERRDRIWSYFRGIFGEMRLEAPELWVQDVYSNRLLNLSQAFLLVPDELERAWILDEWMIPSVEGGCVPRWQEPFEAIPWFHECFDEGMICYLMERSMSEIEKKRSGSYYTPRAWAAYACAEAVNTWLSRGQDRRRFYRDADTVFPVPRVLDPATGAGEFLDAMLDQLASTNDDAATRHPGNANEVRFSFKIEQGLQLVLYGMDINELATRMTKARLFMNVAKHLSWVETEPELLEEFHVNMIREDFLTRGYVPEFFDIVVGNPPYLMEVRNNQEIFRKYAKDKATKKYYEPKMDLFYLFMFRGIEVLKPDGVLGYFIQEYWTDRFHAQNLRRFVFSQTLPIHFIFFKGFRVFSSAPGHHSMFVLFAKGQGTSGDPAIMDRVIGPTSTVGLMESLVNPDPNVLVRVEIEASKVYDIEKDKIYSSGEMERTFLELALSVPHFTFKTREIQLGINIPQPDVKLDGKTKPAFVVPLAWIGSHVLTSQEQGLLKPFHPATHVNAYAFTSSASHYIIYTTNESMKHVEKDREVYPSIRHHLDSVASAITSDHAPYGLHRPRQQEWFEDPAKIIGVRKTASPRFCVVPAWYYMDQGTIFIRLVEHGDVSPYYTCAFLNSKVAARIFSCLRQQGDQLQIDKSTLLRIPVFLSPPEVHDAIAALSKAIHVMMALNEPGTGAEPKDPLIGRAVDEINRMFDDILQSEAHVPDITMIARLHAFTNAMNEIHISEYVHITQPFHANEGIHELRVDVSELKDATTDALELLRASLG
jgi:hypothetical protein